MQLKVACLTYPKLRRYGRIASAMKSGIERHGDIAVICNYDSKPSADVAVIYGWKQNRYLKQYPHYIYADLGFWSRDTHYRMTVNGWGAESYVKAGLPSDRLESFGVSIKPWNEGDEVLLVGSTQKSAIEHGYGYMQWESDMAKRLISMGHKVAYRPKPNDIQKEPIQGCRYDLGDISDSFRRAKLVVAHHSNVAVEALAAGIPVHCAIGAAAAMSTPIESIGERPEGREQFLADVAYLQWSLEEMERGDYWAHIKERGLL
jgi:hypothetical protein